MNERFRVGEAARALIQALALKQHLTEIIGIFGPLFRRAAGTKQFSPATKPFSVFGADIRKHPPVISLQRNGGDRRLQNRRQSDADHQLYPRLRLRPGWSLDGWYC